MHLFNNHESDDSRSGFAAAGLTALRTKAPLRSLPGNPSGETPSERLFVEIFFLVLALHVWLLLYLNRPQPALVDAKPLPMQVTLIAEQKPQAKLPAPPQPRKQAPKLPKKLKPKPTAKPKPEKTPQKEALLAPKPKVEPSQTALEQTAAPVARTSNPAPPAPAKPEPFTEANYKANYGFNPKPSYPRMARSRGWQGKVLLKVQVSAAGDSQGVAVHKSSGHDILDEAAIDAVRKWRFIPARRGNTPVASSVIVPILFSLQND